MMTGELSIRRVITAEADESVVEAARRMAEENVGDLVVVEQISGKAHPIGILTDRDLVTGALSRGTAAALELRVRDVMQPELVTAYDDEHVEVVLDKLRRHTIRRLPIIDRSGALQGILTLDDVVAWIRDQLDLAMAVVEHQTEA